MRVNKLFAIVLIIVMLSTTCVGVSAETDGYRMLQIGEEARVNIVHSEGAETEIQGKRGITLGTTDGNCYIFVNVNDDDMYNLPAGTPIELEVEYYDEGLGHFGVMWESYYPRLDTAYGSSNTEWGFSDTIKLTNTGKWKTLVLSITDSKMLNSGSNYDIRIGTWHAIGGFSASPVTFGDIRVKAGDRTELIKSFGVKSEYVGNNFPTGAPVNFDLQFRNMTDKAVKQELEYFIKDYYGNIIFNGIKETEYAANETKDISFTFDLADKYGIYSIYGKTKDTYVDNLGKAYVKEGELGGFAVVNTPPKDGKRRGRLGLMEAQERTSETTQLSLQAGMWNARIILDWSSFEKSLGQYNMPQDVIDLVNMSYENGQEVVIGVHKPENAYSLGFTTLADEKAQKAFGKACAYVAETFKGKIKYIEILNEFNITNFNPKNEPPEVYAGLLKHAYKEIKKVDPSVKVMGINKANYDYEWCERVFAAGGLEYMDVFNYHPYDWSGVYRWDRFINHWNSLNDLMAKYGEVKPMGITELGFSTNMRDNPDFTEEQQAANMVMTQCMYDAYDIADFVDIYCMWERTNGVEPGFGIVRAKGTVNEGTGKPAYLAIAASNTMIGAAKFKEHIKADESHHIFHYTKTEIGKDVLVLKGEVDDMYATLDLGCPTVDIYDIFGNKISSMKSENGRYNVVIPEIPRYLVGNFSKVSVADTKPLVVADSTVINAPEGDTIELGFTKNTDEELNIYMPEHSDITIVENEGFKNNRAVVKLKIAKGAIKLRFDKEQKICFDVQFKDKDGNFKMIQTMTVYASESITTVTETENVSENSELHWAANIHIKNENFGTVLSGKVTIKSPDYFAAKIKPITFENLEPQKIRTLTLNIPARVIQKIIHLDYSVELSDGNIYEYSELLDFGSATYAEKKPTIDGVMSKEEWTGSWIGCDEKSDVREIADWTGASDLSFSSVSMWDEDYYYMIAVVRDNVHSVNYTPSGAKNLWRGDSVQFAVSDVEFVNTMAVTDFTEIGIAEVPGDGDVVWRFKSSNQQPINVKVEGAEACVKRYDTYTIYETKVPWKEMIGETFVPKKGAKLRFSALVNDNDGVTRRGWIEYSSGIGSKKDLNLFGALTLN